jgi:hypothetical protein
LIGLPHYACEVFIQAHRAFLTPSDRSCVDVVAVVDCASSFLCGSFNNLIAKALDERDGGRVTHFAMIHADIEAPQGWVDRLWGIMSTHRADVVSAIVPIKDDNSDPRTSTAIGNRHDPWHVRRNLMVSEVLALPETFGPELVCSEHDVLLWNTGLWLADLRHPFWDIFTGFDTRARICRKPDGSRFAQQDTEDWRLSRQMDAAGARVVVTRALPVRHWGVRGWWLGPNDEIGEHEEAA